MSATAAQIKELRGKSGAGMLDCKKALEESNCDVEQAIDWLRTKGLAAAAKKSGRTAAEGLVSIAVSGNQGAIIELNSETDFVAKNEQFQELVSGTAAAALHANIGDDVEALKQVKCPKTGKTVEEYITSAISTIGENMNLRRSDSISVESGVIAGYTHNASATNMGRIGVLVAVESASSDTEKLQQIGKQVAMHIAAAKPEALNRDSVSAETLEREREVLIAQAIDSGKPKEIAEKMVEGRIRKYYEEIVLLEQTFVIDGKAKVNEFIAAEAKELGDDIAISDYKYFILGDGVEKEEDDFAAEVAKTAGAA